MDLKSTLYAVDGPVATITLNRPHRLNAWTGRMHAEYRWLLQQAESDSAVRAIVITGAGRGFCAGADSGALEGHVEKGGYDSGLREEPARPGYGVAPELDATFAYHFGLTKPVIVAINGPAAGVGLVLACYADIRIGARGAKLTTAHGKLGLPAEYGLSWLLPRLIGLSRATELLLSSRVFLVEEAAEMGLVHQVVEPGDVLGAAVTCARDLARTVAPSSLASTKRQLALDLHRHLAASVDHSEQLLNEMTTSADFREGVAALLEKREPRWRAP
jgi:enoyl-CoA hydratase/carnithine racemase